MTDVLYRWPEAAKFGRLVAKSKFYAQGTVSSVVRERFVTEVERITWSYKLAEETINLRGNGAVPEIQVFALESKGIDVSHDVLSAIDKAIRQPVIFEVTGTQGTRMIATLKQIGPGPRKLGAYYSTGWMPAGSPREPLPTAISLAGLYSALLQPLTPISIRPGDDLSEVAARLENVRRLEREVASLERKLRTEPQLNRKVQLRRDLKDRRAALASLM